MRIRIEGSGEFQRKELKRNGVILWCKQNLGEAVGRVELSFTEKGRGRKKRSDGSCYFPALLKVCDVSGLLKPQTACKKPLSSRHGTRLKKTTKRSRLEGPGVISKGR